MDTLIGWRLAGISLALSGMTALPHLAGAQGGQPERLRAECPTQTGTIGDWDWSGYANGFTLWAVNVKILERGTYVPIDKGANVGKVPRFFLTDIAGRWKMETNTSRKPATKTISIVATGAQVASGEVPSSVFKPLDGKAKPEQAGPFYATIDVTALLASKAHPADAHEIVLELREDSRTLSRFAIGTKGYAEAVTQAKKAHAEVKALRDDRSCK